MGNIKLLKASAGSGKTYRLAYEYVRNVIAEPFMYRHILAVTFTNKATEEMKRRILSEINDLRLGRNTGYMAQLEADLRLRKPEITSRAKKALTKILHDYSHFSVLTIDKFFQRIIRSFVKELGIDLNFNLELRTDTLLSSAADALIDEISLNDSLRRWITDFVRERIEENRKWDIRTGLMELGSELFGENYKRSSSLISSREELSRIVKDYSSEAYAKIASMKAKASKALALMDSHGLDPADFPYGKGSFANYFCKIATGRIEAPGKRVAEAAASEEKWCAKSSPKRERILAARGELKPILEELCSDYEANAGMFNTAELLRENFRNFALLTDLARKLEELCTTNGIMPISETNQIINKLVSGNDAPFIFEKVGNHFSHFMIDEFQDTSVLQWENFIPLLKNSLSQSPGNPVLLVGDVKQSIYRWRGGDWRILAREIEREFPGVLIEDMAVNYRSLGNVVNFNNELITACVERDNLELNAQLDDATQTGSLSPDQADHLKDMLADAYKNHAQQVPGNHESGYVNLTCYDCDEEGKAVPPVISRIEELQARGYRPSDIAILVRYNADGVEIANMLLEYKKAHPESPYSYDVVTQEALLIGSSPVISFICACMKLSYDSGDSLNLALYNKWFDRAFDASIPEDEDKFLVSLRTRPPLEAFEYLVSHYKLGERSEALAYLQAFHDQIIEFGKSTIADIPLFLKWWNENGATQSVNVPDSRSAITIISIHKSKGLQYKVVIIPYCDWKLTPGSRTVLWAVPEGEPVSEAGVVPVKYKDKMRRSAFAGSFYDELVLSHIDNINTLYVALTRACEELHVMIPDASKRSAERISALIWSCFRFEEENALVGSVAGSTHTEPYGTVFSFGQPVGASPEPGDDDANTISLGFESYEPGDRLRIKYKSERYIAGGASPASSPRDFGVLMHRIFETADNIEGLRTAIEKMVFDGEVSRQEAMLLTDKLSEALENPIIGSWFSGEWDAVRTENTIIVPGDSSSRRPDRVMIKGCRAVIVDYKFGLERPASHKRQIGAYAELLRAMGYTEIEGYIWYVSAGELVRAE